MKTNFLFWMTVLLFSAIGLSGCSDNDGISGNASETIVGIWQGSILEGYEIYMGEREDYSEANDSEYYTFNNDGTGVYDDVKWNDHYTFDWSISGNELIIDEGTTEEERYTIETLNDNTLVLSYSEKEEDYEYYAKSTYIKKTIQ